MKIKMKNREIYNLALTIDQIMKDMPDLPVGVGFYVQKNLNLIYDLAQNIESYKTTIFVKYGTKQEDDQIIIPPELRLKAQQELDELSELTQEIELKAIKLAQFTGIKMNSQCLSAITFMIRENYPEEMWDE